MINELENLGKIFTKPVEAVEHEVQEIRDDVAVIKAAHELLQFIESGKPVLDRFIAALQKREAD